MRQKGEWTAVRQEAVLARVRKNKQNQRGWSVKDIGAGKRQEHRSDLGGRQERPGIENRPLQLELRVGKVVRADRGRLHCPGLWDGPPTQTHTLQCWGPGRGEAATDNEQHLEKSSSAATGDSD